MSYDDFDANDILDSAVGVAHCGSCGKQFQVSAGKRESRSSDLKCSRCFDAGFRADYYDDEPDRSNWS